MTSTLDSSTQQTPIHFGDTRRQNLSFWGGESFGIWSCRFSADGNEVVAGGNGNIFGGWIHELYCFSLDNALIVYDLLANRRTVCITAHSDDVNSCCWADTASGNVLISASDDSFLKVWFVILAVTKVFIYTKCPCLGTVDLWALQGSLREC
jgi:DDB1- and CUL4-associated factor 11